MWRGRTIVRKVIKCIICNSVQLNRNWFFVDRVTLILLPRSCGVKMWEHFSIIECEVCGRKLIRHISRQLGYVLLFYCGLHTKRGNLSGWLVILNLRFCTNSSHFHLLRRRSWGKPPKRLAMICETRPFRCWPLRQ